jgi:serine/threonine protein kinase
LNFKSQDANIFETKFDNADPLALDLLRNLLVVNPKKRLIIEKILEHPYLSNEKNYLDVLLPVL